MLFSDFTKSGLILVMQFSGICVTGNWPAKCYRRNWRVQGLERCRTSCKQFRARQKAAKVTSLTRWFCSVTDQHKTSTLELIDRSVYKIWLGRMIAFIGLPSRRSILRRKSPLVNVNRLRSLLSIPVVPYKYVYPPPNFRTCATASTHNTSTIIISAYRPISFYLIHHLDHQSDW